MHNTKTGTYLFGWRVWLGRVLWSLFAGLTVALLFYSLSTLSIVLEALHDDVGDGFALGVAVFSIIRRYVLVIAFYGGSILLFWQRSHERMVLLASMMLMSLGAFPLATGVFNITGKLIEIPAIWQWITLIVLVCTITVSLLVAYLYPNGRFVPGWARWLIIPTVIASLYYGISYRDSQSIPLISAFSILSLLVLATWMQLKRFQEAPPLQRQQIKFFVFGLAWFIIFQLVGLILHGIVGGTSLSGSLFSIFSEVVFLLSYLGLLISLSLAVIRYRLWDIDFFINRSLVYAGVTLLLGIVFLGVFFGIQTILALVLNQPDPTLSLSIGVVLVLVLFQPTRTLTRRFIDRRFYGIDIDYSEIARREDARQQEAFSGEDEDTFGSYGRVVAVGRGGMGIVYRAMDPQRNIPIAIKVLKEANITNPEIQARFQREARVMRDLDHPNIIRIYDSGTLQNIPYITMEYVEGVSLSDELKVRGALSFHEVVPILRDIALALDYAHERGIVHRDIKPANIMLDRASKDREAVLMDFGIARILDATRLTQTDGMLMGTLDYIAPEQIRGESHITPQADVYSLGIMAYHLLTGESPFRRDNAGATILAHLMQPPPDPRLKVPNLSADAALAIMQAISKDPTDRFASAGEFISELR